MTSLTTTPSTPALHRLLGLLAATVGCGALLLLLGAAPLQVPLTSVTEFLDWVDATPAPVMAVSALRLAALVACAYLIVVLGITLALTAGGRARAAHRALHLTPLALRRLVVSGVGLGMAAQASLGTTPAAAQEGAGQPSDDVAVMIQLGPDEPPAPPSDPEPEIATMEFLTPEPGTGAPPTTAPGGTTTSASTTTPSDQDPGRHADHSEVHPRGHRPEAEDRAAGTGEPSADNGVWVVEPGESFWTVAERLAAEDGSDDVTAYWYRLIDANRAELADPENPDLLFPGQELTVPR